MKKQSQYVSLNVVWGTAITRKVAVNHASAWRATCCLAHKGSQLGFQLGNQVQHITKTQDASLAIRYFDPKPQDESYQGNVGDVYDSEIGG